MKNHIPIENRIARAKSFKTDNVVKNSQILKKLEKLHQHFKKLSDDEVEKMWPSIEYPNANDNKLTLNKKTKIKNKEFLITLLARANQTVNAIRFAKENANLDLKDKQVQESLKSKSEELGRNF